MIYSLPFDSLADCTFRSFEIPRLAIVIYAPMCATIAASARNVES